MSECLQSGIASSELLEESVAPPPPTERVALALHEESAELALKTECVAAPLFDERVCQQDDQWWVVSEDFHVESEDELLVSGP